jgi:hypothetical protein
LSDQGVDVWRGVVHPPGVGAIGACDVEEFLGDVDAYEGPLCGRC